MQHSFGLRLHVVYVVRCMQFYHITSPLYLTRNCITLQDQMCTGRASQSQKLGDLGGRTGIVTAYGRYSEHWLLVGSYHG